MTDVDPKALEGDPRVAWVEDVVRFSDTDLNGHVNNAAFAVFCESGRVNFLLGVLGPVREPGRFFVVAKLAIVFRAELHYPGRVRSGTWISHLGRTSIGFGQVILDADGRLVATSEAVTVSMDKSTRKPSPISGPMRDLVLSRLRPEAF